MELQIQSDVTTERLMLPPPPGTFQDREELIKHVREFGASQGYVVTIKKSRRDRRVILGCDRGGVYRNRRKMDESKRKRKACSRLINCPFEAIGKKDDDVWVLTIRNGEHNHEPLRDMSEHPYSRRFTEDEVRQIKQMTEAGVKPRQVLKTLKQSNPEFQSTPRHLYNLKAKIRQGKFSENNFKSWRPNMFMPLSTSADELEKHSYPLRVPNYIGGKFEESQASESIDVINPATQEVVSRVPLTTHEEFKAAVTAAKHAFPMWRNTPVTMRQRIMFKFQELIRRDIDKIVENIATEQGKTLNGAKGDVLRGLEVVEQSCGMATLQMGEFIPNATSGVDTYCIREPLGVCAGICPLNLPEMISLWMFPIAVTCGNTFILKPSVKNPGASMMLAALAAEAGLPDGVLNVVHGGQEIINYMCDDDDVKAISLVGSNTAGMHTYARAATRGKRVQSNMEAKNHAVVMPDANPDATLDAIIGAGFGAAGQRCMTLSTIIFVGGLAPWEQELVNRANALKVNAGTEVGADLGPVISKEAKDHICSLVQGGVESGARLLLDGRNIVVPRYEQGNFLGPTILCDAATDMECYKEEMFGPVLLCMQADRLEEAIAIVNRNRHVNGASIFTTSGVAARKFQNDVESGLVGINVAVPIPLPFSSVNGSKASFSGDLNFCGKAGVQFYTQIKTVAQQWKDLPTRRVSLPHPPTSETEISSRGTFLSQPLSSESDLPSREVSPAMPLALENDLPTENLYLPLPPSEGDVSNVEVLPSTPPTREPELPKQEGALAMSSISERDSVNLKVSLLMPLAAEIDAAGQSESSSLCSVSERTYPCQTSQWGDPLPLISQSTETAPSTAKKVYMAPNSQRIDTLTPGIQRTDTVDASDSERLYFPVTCSSEINPIFLRNDSVSPMSLRHDIQMTDINVRPASEMVYMPVMSEHKESVGPTSQRTGVLHLKPDKMYMASHRRDGMGMMPLMAKASVPPASGSLYMSTSCSNVMASTSDKMSVPTEIQHDGISSKSERLFMPASSQGIYAENQIMSAHNYRGQITPQTHPSSQSL
ncbi:methylmalonate-semialdehyde dehydrogenase [acylating], mitochondrial-like [Coffea eugenioides]|uniref:methylmalonate-semialdehyde dehydrogenase [acylating], mitochondrial-like n=2 Tax=Coffea eugenioides TaxID=49369 RepID=UPI000F6129E7|nr:methylmalonate-semialdehyde dehydrogenase [acylating], mitochondrial-like [Coffea eugenioides]